MPQRAVCRAFCHGGYYRAARCLSARTAAHTMICGKIKKVEEQQHTIMEPNPYGDTITVLVNIIININGIYMRSVLY